jgi:ATP-grasp domain
MNESISSLNKGNHMSRPRILLAGTTRWAVVARLAGGFAKLGCEVAVLGPSPGHPARRATGVHRIFHYDGLRPLVSLRSAIEAYDPEIVIPTCDRSVQHLHELHATTVAAGDGRVAIATLIERSLGAPESFSVASSRESLIRIARSEGIPVPETRSIRELEDLRNWSTEYAPPWVIKADGTWGGRGVRIALSRDEAERYFAHLMEHGSHTELIKRMILNRGRDWVLSEWKLARPGMIAQSYINGRPANCAVACWQGKVLAGIAVEVITANGAQGPANIVEVVPGREMLSAAEKIARRLGITGFFGLDFMIESGTGATYLIEMNPRCTPPCSLPLGKGRDLVAAIVASLTRQEELFRQPIIMNTRIAYFPQVLLGKGDSSQLGAHSAYLDIPEDEPELIQDLLHPWSERSVSGRLLDFLRGKFSAKQPPPEYLFGDQQ